MNILILTGRFGMGHDSAANALYEQIDTLYNNTNIEIVDIVDYMFKNMNKPIYKTLNLMANNCSSLYNLYTSFTDKKNSIPMKKIVSKKISKLIEMNSSNLILSTLPLASQIISAYKENTRSDIPLYTYITDVEIHEEWIASNTKLYFVGAELTKEKLIAKGVESEKIIVSYVDNVHYYMQKSDILITKSGAITTFEAINSQIPLFVIKPFLKQEVGNAKFIEKESLERVALVGNTDLVEDIISFANNRVLNRGCKREHEKITTRLVKVLAINNI